MNLSFVVLFSLLHSHMLTGHSATYCFGMCYFGKLQKETSLKQKKKKKKKNPCFAWPSLDLDHVQEMLHAATSLLHACATRRAKNVPGLYLGPGISALRVPYKPGFIMHIITYLNVARGRINHFPTSLTHSSPHPTPTPPPCVTLPLKTSPTSYSSDYKTRQFPSGGLLFPGRRREGSVLGLRSLNGWWRWATRVGAVPDWSPAAAAGC